MHSMAPLKYHFHSNAMTDFKMKFTEWILLKPSNLQWLLKYVIRREKIALINLDNPRPEARQTNQVSQNINFQACDSNDIVKNSKDNHTSRLRICVNFSFRVWKNESFNVAIFISL